MAATLESSLNGIFDHLRRLGRGIAGRQAPGLDPAMVRRELADIGLVAPDDLVMLYALSDGMRANAGETIGEIVLFPGYYWLSLDEALETHRLDRDDPEKSRNWFPLFSSGGGDLYAVVCDTASPDHGAIVGFLRGEPDHLVEFESIAAMFEIIDQCYARGVIVRDGPYIDWDAKRMRAIAGSVQPAFAEHPARVI